MNDTHPLAIRFYAALETYHYDRFNHNYCCDNCSYHTASVHCDSDEFAAFVLRLESHNASCKGGR